MQHCDRRVRRGSALLSVLLTFATGTALAHSTQERTFPADGAVLPGPPDVVSMTFDAPMRITVIHLTSEMTGDTFELERTDGMQPVTDFRATPPVLPNGLYAVEWRGLSSDGHPMQCRFSFEVAK